MEWLKARSSVVEHCFDVARASGSIPLAPTTFKIVSFNVNVSFVYNTEFFVCRSPQR